MSTETYDPNEGVDFDEIALEMQTFEEVQAEYGQTFSPFDEDEE